MKPVTFFVPGRPRPKGSTRAFAYKDKRTGKTRAATIASNSEALDGWESRIFDMARQFFLAPTTDPVEVSLAFYLLRPRSHFRANGTLKPSAPDYPTGKPDLDKLVRGALDPLTGVAYRDDSLIVALQAEKLYAWDGREGMQLLMRRRTCPSD